MIHGPPATVITDRLTARILGALLVFLPVVTVASSFHAVKPELRTQPGFLAVVFAMSLPFVGLGIYFLRRANKLTK